MSRMASQSEQQRLARLAQTGGQGGVLLPGPQVAGQGRRPDADAVGIAAQLILTIDGIAAPQFHAHASIAVAAIIVPLQTLALGPDEQMGSLVAVGRADGQGDEIARPIVVSSERLRLPDEATTLIVQQDRQPVAAKTDHVRPAVEVHIHGHRLAQRRRIGSHRLEPLRRRGLAGFGAIEQQARSLVGREQEKIGTAVVIDIEDQRPVPVVRRGEIIRQGRSPEIQEPIVDDHVRRCAVWQD